jgi:peptide methionine sulfoxide reductase MsrB
MSEGQRVAQIRQLLYEGRYSSEDKLSCSSCGWPSVKHEVRWDSSAGVFRIWTRCERCNSVEEGVA